MELMVLCVCILLVLVWFTIFFILGKDRIVQKPKYAATIHDLAPSREHLEKLSKRFDIPLDFLIELNDLKIAMISEFIIEHNDHMPMKDALEISIKDQGPSLESFNELLAQYELNAYETYQSNLAITFIVTKVSDIPTILKYVDVDFMAGSNFTMEFKSFADELKIKDKIDVVLKGIGENYITVAFKPKVPNSKITDIAEKFEAIKGNSVGDDVKNSLKNRSAITLLWQ